MSLIIKDLPKPRLSADELAAWRALPSPLEHSERSPADEAKRSGGLPGNGRRLAHCVDSGDDDLLGESAGKMLAEDSERLAVNDVVVAAKGAGPARHGGIDDDLIANLETAHSLPYCVDHARPISTCRVGEVLGGGETLGYPEVEMVQGRVLDLKSDFAWARLRFGDVVEDIRVDPLRVGELPGLHGGESSLADPAPKEGSCPSTFPLIAKFTRLR